MEPEDPTQAIQTQLNYKEVRGNKVVDRWEPEKLR